MAGDRGDGESEDDELSEEKLAAWAHGQTVAAEIETEQRVYHAIRASIEKEDPVEQDWLTELRRDLGAPSIGFTRKLAALVVEWLHGIDRDEAVRRAFGFGVRTGRALTEREAREREARRAASDHE